MDILHINFLFKSAKIYRIMGLKSFRKINSHNYETKGIAD